MFVLYHGLNGLSNKKCKKVYGLDHCLFIYANGFHLPVVDVAVNLGHAVHHIVHIVLVDATLNDHKSLNALHVMIVAELVGLFEVCE